MGAPRVFAGMFVALIVFAVVTYYVTGSLFVTILETIAAAILLQLGYFFCVVFLIWRQSKHTVVASDSEGIIAADAKREENHPALPHPPFNQSGPFGR